LLPFGQIVFPKKGICNRNILFSENCVAFQQFVTKKKKRVNKGIPRMGPALGYGWARAYYVSSESHYAS
jgi:hypothetical protein